jgi:5'(3')-deoxyribonucleotidase
MIYWDLDDVAADFAGAVTRLTGTPHGIGDVISLTDWETVRREAPRIFRDLDVVDEVKNIIIALEEAGFKQAFLTALPFDGNHPWQYAGMDKVDWVRKNFPFMDIFFGPYAHQKLFHAKPGDILIDDKLTNITEWESAGGIGHLYSDPRSCKRFLEDNIPWMKFL